MSETMTRDFEKQFPLPFEYDSKRNIIKDKNGKMMMLMPFAVMTLEQIEHCDALGTYLAACANLMPEAIKLIKEGLKKKMETCAMCDDAPDHEECSTCPLNARIAEAKAFLAKFEKEPE